MTVEELLSRLREVESTVAGLVRRLRPVPAGAGDHRGQGRSGPSEGRPARLRRVLARQLGTCGGDGAFDGGFRVLVRLIHKPS